MKNNGGYEQIEKIYADECRKYGEIGMGFEGPTVIPTKCDEFSQLENCYFAVKRWREVWLAHRQYGDLVDALSCGLEHHDRIKERRANDVFERGQVGYKGK